LLITPLGDLVRRRPLILLLSVLAAGLTIGLPITSSVTVFEVLSLLVGFTSVVPQIMMPFAADLAPPERRASAIAIVLSGLLLGVMYARVIAGTIANFVTWRVVYWLALGLQAVMLVLFYFMLPDFPAKNTNLSYFGILLTMAKFAVTEPLLIQAALINIAGSACFTNFWVFNRLACVSCLRLDECSR
jgi:predicted MFS family arabinose efflux permease